jgi:hypothetical protein
MINAKLAHTYYGEPVSGIRAAAHAPNSQLAPPGAPYLGRGNFCSANDDTCEGRKAKGTDFCMGHLRSKGEA